MTLLTTAVPRPDPVPPPGRAPLRIRADRVGRTLADTVGQLLTGGPAADRAPAVLAAATVLLVCLPTGGDRDVTAAVHVTTADVVSVGLVGVCGLRVVAALRRGATGLLPVRAALLFAGVLLAAAVATAASQDPAQSLSGFVRIVQVFVLVPLAVLLSLRERRDLRLLLGALVAAAVVEGSVGVEQYLTGTGASYDGGTVRAVGTFGAQDIMAMSAVVSYGLIAALGLALEARAARRRRAAAGYGLAALLLVVPLALSFSRGSWIATGCAVTLALLLTDVRLLLRGAVFALAAAVVLVGGLGLGGDSVVARLGSIASVTGGAPDHSVSDRYDLWATAGAIWRQHPATGIGPKEFPQFRDAHAPLRLSSGSDTAGAGAGYSREPLLSPHNMYLLVLSEQGLIGLTAFGALFLGVFLTLLLRLLRPGPGTNGLGAALLGLLVWQLVDFVYADIGGPATVLVSFVLGLAAFGAFGAAGTS